MKHLSFLTICYTVFLTLSSHAQFPGGGSFNTGFDGIDRLDSGIEPSWTISDTRNGQQFPAEIIGACGNNWEPPQDNANWIGYCSTRGTYYFHLNIFLPPYGCEQVPIETPGSFVVNLLAWADDRVTNVWLNGSNINFNQPNTNRRTPAEILLDRFWIAGDNEITIEVVNDNGNGAGLMVSASAIADSDGDGISDVQDKCPCTERPDLNVVDLDGCIPEICNNGIDDDGDGLIDGNDPDCITISGLCQGILGDNVILDGDFGSGVANVIQNDPNFAPGYTYTTRTPPDDGFYTITNNTTNWGSFAAGRNWIDIGDNSNDPNGYMMVVNANFTPGVFFERTFSNLCPNTLYEFSADIISMAFEGKNVILPNIDFLLGGRVVYSTGDIPEDEEWHRYGFSFSTGDNVTATTFTMRNNAPGGTGNDLAIDNISLRPCGPLMSISVETNLFCPNQVIPFTAVIDPDPDEYQYAWQKRDTRNPNNPWINIPSTNQLLLSIVPEDQFEYRIAAATSLSNLSNNACIYTSNTITMFEKSFDLPLQASETICPGDSIGIDAGNDANRYSWTPANNISDPDINNPIVFPTTTTTYFVTAFFADGCFSEDSITINVRPRPPADAGDTVVVCPGEVANLGASGGQIYRWEDDPGLSNLNISNPFALTDISNSYTVTVTDQFGCEGTDSVFVRVSEAKPFAGFDPSICLGGSVQLQATGGVNYAWFPTTNMSDPTVSNPVVAPLSTTEYILTTINADNCVGTDTLMVEVTVALTAEAGPNASICPGDSVRLSGRGGAIYNWTRDPTLSDTTLSRPFAKPLADTRYYLKVSDNSGCFDIDSVDVFVLPDVTANAGLDRQLCIGDSVLVQGTAVSNGSSKINYEWSPDLAISSSNTAQMEAFPISTKEYILTATNEEGCFDRDTMTVEVFSLPIVDAGNDTSICIGGEAQFNATGGTQYAWDPNPDLSSLSINNPFARPQQDTLYFVTVTDGNGCSDMDSVRVNINEDPEVQAGADLTICQGDSIEIRAAGFGLADWFPALGLSDPNRLRPQASPDQTQDYIITLTDLNGCIAQDTMTLFVRPLPPADAGPDTSICVGDSVGLLGSGGFVYTWSPAGEVENADAQNTISVPNSDTQYILNVIDGFLCENSDSINVEVNAVPIALASEDIQICLGEQTTLQGTGGGEYFWTPAISLSDSSLQSPIAQPDTSTWYTLGVRNTDGCEDTDSVFVEVLAIPDANAGEDLSICEGDEPLLQASGGDIYQWRGPAGFSDPDSDSTIVLGAQTGTYIISVGLNNGCFIEDSLELVVNPLPSVFAGPDQEICEGDVLSLVGISNGAQFSWTPSARLENPTFLSTQGIGEESRTYVLTATNIFGCVQSDSMELTVNPLPDVSLDTLFKICETQEITLSVQGDALFQWSTGQTDSSITVSPSRTTNYSVTPISFEGCIGEELPARVEVLRWPVAGFTTNVDEGVTPLDIEYINTSQHASDYLWNFGNGVTSTEFEPIYTYEKRGTYYNSLIVSNELGCADTAYKSILVYAAAIYLPNAFSPNLDGENDFYTFTAYGLSGIQAKVFSRWGDLIHEHEGEGFKWDGTYKGEDVPEGVYVITVNATNKKGKKIHQVSTITLFR